jgi:hypothetical protein
MKDNNSLPTDKMTLAALTNPAHAGVTLGALNDQPQPEKKEQPRRKERG